MTIYRQSGREKARERKRRHGQTEGQTTRQSVENLWKIIGKASEKDEIETRCKETARITQQKC